jgi:hypothetical protein
MTRFTCQQQLPQTPTQGQNQPDCNQVAMQAVGPIEPPTTILTSILGIALGYLKGGWAGALTSAGTIQALNLIAKSEYYNGVLQSCQISSGQTPVWTPPMIYQ